MQMKQNTIVSYWKRSINNIDIADQTECNDQNNAKLAAPCKKIKHNITVEITKVRKWKNTYCICETVSICRMTNL